MTALRMRSSGRSFTVIAKSAFVALVGPLALARPLHDAASQKPGTETGEAFSGPPAANVLSHAQVVELACAADPGDRQLPSSGGDTAAQPSMKDDPVQQVRLGLGGEGEVVVTFATRQRGLSSSITYGSESEGLVREATGEASTYVVRMCPQYPLGHPVMSTNGGLPPVSDKTLADIVNTSRLGLPEESGAYKYIAKPEDAWQVIASKNYCFHYKNPLAYYESPYLHTVVLKDLLPRVTYVYRPVAGARTFKFTMPPRAGESDSAQPLKLAVWGDIGVTNVSFASMQDVLGMKPDVVLTVGDYSYSDGWAPRWDTFGTMMEPLLSRIPELGVVGNHELDSGFAQAVDWRFRYPQPYRQSGSENSAIFSYDTGLVHVLGLPGTYAPSSNGTGDLQASSQYQFAAEDLAHVDRTRTPWVVVMFHTPWYSSNEHHYLEGLKHQWDMEELFHSYGVDLVLSGHVHAYERTQSVYKYEADPCGTTYIVAGDAGNYEGPVPTWMQPRPEWSAFREASFGVGSLTVLNSTHASWEWRRLACAHTSANPPWFTDEGRVGLDGVSCGSGDATSGDNSEDRRATVDTAMFIRDVNACPNKKGAADRRLSIHV